MKQPLILKSKVEELVRAQEYLCRLKEEKKWTSDFFFRVEVSVLEAVKNAIVHGNKCCLDKNVALYINDQDNSILFRIMDEGKGFDRDCIVDPREISRRCLENGRGLLIMEELSDRIIYSANCVELFFREREC